MLIVETLCKTRLVILAAILSPVATTLYERRTFEEEKQIYSSYDVIFTTSGSSAISCAWSCHKHDGCVSLFHNTGSGTCIGSKDPCEVSTGQEEDKFDMYACWTVGTSQPGQPSPARDCLDVLSGDQSVQDGVYSITTVAGTEVDVYCVMSKRGGGWTVLLRRYNGEVPFNRSFEEYEEGFGDKAGEHWLGLRYIHEMTATVPSDIHIKSSGGLFPGTETEVYEEWSDFSIGPGLNYTIQVGSLITWTYGYTESTFGYFNASTGHGFSTIDRPLDSCVFAGRCANGLEQGGFWYYCCPQLNPTGVYVQPHTNGAHVMFNRMLYGDNSLKEMTLMYRRATVEE